MVTIVQLHCPARHVILAMAGEAPAGELQQRLHALVKEWLDSSGMNPWCGMCGMSQDTWIYHAVGTPFDTIDDAVPTIRDLQDAEMTLRDTLTAQGRTFDAMRRGAGG